MYYDEDLRIELPERLEKIVRDHERRAVKRAVEKERRIAKRNTERAVEKERRIAKRNTEIATKKAAEKERRYNIKCLLNKGMDLDDILNTFGIPKKEKKKYISLL